MSITTTFDNAFVQVFDTFGEAGAFGARPNDAATNLMRAQQHSARALGAADGVPMATAAEPDNLARLLATRPGRDEFASQMDAAARQANDGTRALSAFARSTDRAGITALVPDAAEAVAAMQRVHVSAYALADLTSHQPAVLSDLMMNNVTTRAGELVTALDDARGSVSSVVDTTNTMQDAWRGILDDLDAQIQGFPLLPGRA